ncbi:LLM class oxidoreductase [Tsukamurella soli]|uniref:Luciferase-like monooxygenase n=1 Tax=Tsukamurella soli TaxID=644556 RepID=A0ABP8JUI6_9ACTN
MTTPYLALGLSGPHLLELAGDAGLLARWDGLPLAFTVLGIDRIEAGPPATATLDGSAAGAALAGRTDSGRFLVAATPQRDHPYNLARRVASLGHLSRGRSGVVFGVRDAYAARASLGPAGDGEGAWAGARLGDPAPLNADTAAAAARAVRALERSWPHDSIVADRAAGILVRSHEITHVDLEGAYRIAGPLNAPEPAAGPSVIAWYAAESGGTVADGQPFDIVLGPGDLLRAGPDRPLADVLAAAERLLTGRYAPAPRGPLRAALGLGVPTRWPGGRPAFPAPQPNPALGAG